MLVDGQNLFHAAREAFGHRHPNYDVHALAIRLCEERWWRLVQTRFYTSVPTRADNLGWRRFWEAKLRAISPHQSAKFWLAPVALVRNLGFTAVELRRVQRLGAEHEPRSLEAWNEYFRGSVG